MQPYDIRKLLAKLKHVYAEKAVRTGFDDDSIYSDELLTLKDADLNDFNGLKTIVGITKKEKAPTKITVNENLSDQEYNQAQRGSKKSRKERTPEEQAAMDKMNALRNQRRTLISILRSVSIRIPLMIYGMNMDIDEDIDIHTFVNKVDDESWKEFMPAGVTKDLFNKFIKYYDADVFIEAGHIIRQKIKAYDGLDPEDRTEKLLKYLIILKIQIRKLF